MDGQTIKTMMSSIGKEYETPDHLFNALDKVFSFTLDVCATSHNTKVKGRYIGHWRNALTVDWGGRFWMNPPYGRKIGKWVDRAAKFGAVAGNLGVCLLPSRTETKWFQTIWNDACLICFVSGRLRFKGADSCAPFPSVIAVFGDLTPSWESYAYALSEWGNVVINVGRPESGVIVYNAPAGGRA